MSVLDGLGLEPETTEPGTAPQEPVAPAEPTEPVDEAPEEVVVPDGAENPDAVKNLIQAERKKARDAYAKAKDLERQLEAKLESEKPAEERLSGLTARAEAAELKALRLEVGVASGLSVKLASRLTGTTAEELATDAAELLAELGTKPKPQVPGLDGGPKPTPPAAPTDPALAHNATLVSIIAKHKTGQ